MNGLDWLKSEWRALTKTVKFVAWVVKWSFTETANLVAFFSIFGSLIFLTTSVWLLYIGFSLEIVYLSVAWYFCWKYPSGRFKSRLEAHEAEHKAPVEGQARKRANVLDQMLLCVTVAGGIIILFFGFGKHLLNHRFPTYSHTAGWELGALSWTGLFLFYYLAKAPHTNNGALNKFIVSVLSGGSSWLIWFAWRSMDQPMKHMIYVLAIGVCLLLIDFLLSRQYSGSSATNMPRTAFLLVDAPMVAAFVVLVAFLWAHPDTEHREVFVSGVVACELLISNVIFTIMEFGVLEKTGSAGGSAPLGTVGHAQSVSAGSD